MRSSTIAVEHSVDEARAAGLVAPADDLVHVRHVVTDDGPDRGLRVVVVHADGGVATEILLDRGMDLGATWVGGRPVSWTSPVARAGRGHVDGGAGWLDGWVGGLMTTCGLRNVGSPSEGHGQHGSYTELAAHEVATQRVQIDGRAAVQISGVLDDASSLGAHLRVERVITVVAGSPEVTVVDRTTNLGTEREQTPLLYHVNLGYPLLTPESTYEIDGETCQPMGEPARGAADRIVSHPVQEGRASIDSPALGLRAVVTWDLAEQPHLHTWRRNEPGSYVASIEPANCTLDGRTADREAGIAPFLEPGQVRTTWVRIAFER